MVQKLVHLKNWVEALDPQTKNPPAEADEIGQQHRNLARLNQSWVGEFPPSSCSEAVPLEHLEEEIIDL